jgi:hypothetical protein
MRTTIRLDEDLLAEVRLAAARSGKSMTAVIEDALREVFARQQARADASPVKLTTVAGHGPQPGVDLDDSAALLSLMEATNDPD